MFGGPINSRIEAIQLTLSSRGPRCNQQDEVAETSVLCKLLVFIIILCEMDLWFFRFVLSAKKMVLNWCSRFYMTIKQTLLLLLLQENAMLLQQLCSRQLIMCSKEQQSLVILKHHCYTLPSEHCCIHSFQFKLSFVICIQFIIVSLIKDLCTGHQLHNCPAMCYWMINGTCLRSGCN